MLYGVFDRQLERLHPAGVGGGGRCGPLPKTLTRFMTKICDIPYPIYDLTNNLKPYL